MKREHYHPQTRLHSGLEVRQSRIHGKGFHARQPIRAGEVVIEFGGTLFSKADIDAGKANNPTLMQVDDAMWLGNRVDEPLGDDYFINHSCDPNLWMLDEVTLVARRQIGPGEEVTMDYAMHFADPAWTMRNLCQCGSTLCRRTITGRDWMTRGLQERYGAHFSPLVNKRIARLRKLE